MLLKKNSITVKKIDERFNNTHAIKIYNRLFKSEHRYDCITATVCYENNYCYYIQYKFYNNRVSKWDWSDVKDVLRYLSENMSSNSKLRSIVIN